MKEMWDERYAADEYVYGKAPNQFFKETLHKYKLKGKLLCPAEGEGRNAVFAAKQGMDVLAYDYSIEAKKKAMALAKSEGVSIEYQVGTIDELNLKAATFDAVVLTFVHMPDTHRYDFHCNIAALIKPGGMLILEGFSKDNMRYIERKQNSAGPKNEAFLFNLEEIKNDFSQFEVLSLEETESELDAGVFHKGTGKLIRFTGLKK